MTDPDPTTKVVTLKKHRTRRRISATTPALLAVLLFALIACDLDQSEETRARRATGGTPKTTTVKSGAQLQKFLDAALPGDELVLEAGATFTGNFTLPVKSGDAFITIRSSRCAELPAGERVSPAQSTLMARLATPNVAPVLLAPPGSHHWRVQCLEFTQASTVETSGYNLIQLGDEKQKTLESVPHHLEFDRVIVRARDDRTAVQRGITLNSASTSVTNSHISGIKWDGVETQAVGGWNGPGPFEITNNYLEASGENILFGGATPSIPGLVPSDIKIKGNHIFKPLSWRQEDPSFSGTAWTVKNLIELKNARRVEISDNLMENNWVHGQVGWAVIFNTFRDGGWEVIEDVQFVRNRIRNSTNGINLRGLDDGDKAVRMRRINVADNVIENLGVFGQEGRAFQLLSASENVTVDHNTVSGRVTHMLTIQATPGFVHESLVYTNNVIPHGLYGIFGDGGLIGSDALNKWASKWTLAKNAIIGTPGELRAKYPRNYFPASPQEAVRLMGTDNLPVGARNLK